MPTGPNGEKRPADVNAPDRARPMHPVVPALGFLMLVGLIAPAAAQPDFALKAACIGGAANTVTEVIARADGTISRRRDFRSKVEGKQWQVLARDPARVNKWLKAVDATPVSPVRVPVAEDRNPCKVGSSRPCHIVRRKGKVDYYACRAEAVLNEMMDFTEWTRETEARNAAFPIFEQWIKAFADSDVDAILKLYAPDATFIGEDSKTVIGDPTEIRKYFENELLAGRPRAAIINFQQNEALSDDAVLVTGLYESRGVLDGKPFSKPGRFTFIIARRNAEWLIVHFHRSAMPQ